MYNLVPCWKLPLRKAARSSLVEFQINPTYQNNHRFFIRTAVFEGGFTKGTISKEEAGLPTCEEPQHVRSPARRFLNFILRMKGDVPVWLVSAILVHSGEGGNQQTPTISIIEVTTASRAGTASPAIIPLSLSSDWVDKEGNMLNLEA